MQLSLRRIPVRLLAVLLLASTAPAQNLRNGDFEKPWSGTLPPDWGWAYNVAVAKEQVNTFSGDQAVKLTTSQTWAEFGKQWTQYIVPGANKRIQGRFRLKLSDANLAGPVRVVAYEFNPSGNPQWHYGTKDVATVDIDLPDEVDGATVSPSRTAYIHEADKSPVQTTYGALQAQQYTVPENGVVLIHLP